MGNQRRRRRKPNYRKRVLRLPDLEYSRTAVLNSLPAPSSQESYRHAIDEFIGWYCSEPRLALNRTVVLRYRFSLEERKLAPATINVRLAAVRRLAWEAADSGLLSPELAASIRRVKGVRRIGVRVGNWLTPDQCRTLLEASSDDSLRGRRDRAILSVLIGCGLRRSEVVQLSMDDIQVREEHWVIADLIGKANHIRTVPVPTWVKDALDEWTGPAGIDADRLFRRIHRTGRVSTEGLSAKAIWQIVRDAATRAGIPGIAPHDLRRYAECLIMPNVVGRATYSKVRTRIHSA